MASNTQEFISRSTFKKLSLQYKEENRDAKNWTELPTDGTIFKIINVDKIKNGTYGEAFLLTIIDKSGEESKVFAPKKLKEEIKEEEKQAKPRSIFFCSMGQVKKPNGYRKNEYDICFK